MKGGNHIYLTVKQQVKHLSKEDYIIIKELCHTAKDLANEAIYNVRQYYFAEGEFLKYEKNYALLKNSPNYKTLNSNMAQQIPINQWFNKENARLQSIKDKQGFGKRTTNRQKAIARDRNNKVNDYMSKAARKIIDYCIANDIGTLVVGYNETFQRGSNLGEQTNQNFVNIPYGKLRDKLQYLCELNGIMFVKQEESYTSKASFWDKDDIPVYNADNPQGYEFSGNRIHRGMYKTKDGITFNADVNGALNILRKSSVVSLETLYSRGDVDTPIRIRVA